MLFSFGQLKKEVSELNLQLELAHAQIEDMRQQTGKNTPASALQVGLEFNLLLIYYMPIQLGILILFNVL